MGLLDKKILASTPHGNVSEEYRWPIQKKFSDKKPPLESFNLCPSCIASLISGHGTPFLNRINNRHHA